MDDLKLLPITSSSIVPLTLWGGEFNEGGMSDYIAKNMKRTRGIDIISAKGNGSLGIYNRIGEEGTELL